MVGDVRGLARVVLQRDILRLRSIIARILVVEALLGDVAAARSARAWIRVRWVCVIVEDGIKRRRTCLALVVCRSAVWASVMRIRIAWVVRLREVRVCGWRVRVVVVRGSLVALRLPVVAIVEAVCCHGERAVPRALTPRTEEIKEGDSLDR